MWRCPAAYDALRGGTCTANSRRKMAVAEGMGRASGPATRDASSDRRGRQASGRARIPAVRKPVGIGSVGWTPVLYRDTGRTTMKPRFPLVAETGLYGPVSRKLTFVTTSSRALLPVACMILGTD